MNWYDASEMPSTTGWVAICVLALFFYYITKLFRGTRGAAILSGLIVLFTVLFVVTSLVRLDILNWMLQKLMLYISLAFVIIFQPEIRRMLAGIGRQPVWTTSAITSQKNLVEPIMQTVQLLSARKIGALIAIERDIGTRSIQDTGTRLSARVSSELLATIFFPHTPLHDGGVIISGDRICAAGCIFPLSQKEGLSKTLGTRHRAAIGVTEETDAVVIVVSEETGVISIAYNGRLRRGMTDERLRRVLSSMLGRKRTGLARFQQKIEEGEVNLSDTVLGLDADDA